MYKVEFRYKATVSYDGTIYGGWQSQTNALSIQRLVENALQTVLRAPIPVVSASRTDAGVHALAQVVHFSSPISLDLRRLLRSLNGILPGDIRLLAIEPVSSTFHARYDALSKEYHYHLGLDQVPTPFTRLYRTHLFHPFDLAQVRNALPLFLGTHDFTSFANDSHDPLRNPIRTLTRLDLMEEPGGVRFEFEGNGFLYKMVRTIVGTLVAIGKGRLLPEKIPAIFAARNRRLAGESAPPQALFLVKVNYSTAVGLVNDPLTECRRYREGKNP